MSTAERFQKLFWELWDISPVITIIMILVPVYFIGKLVVGLFVGNSDSDSSSYVPPTPEEMEEKKRWQEKQQEMDNAAFLAYKAYQLEKWRSNAVCGHCLNKCMTTDEDGNEYYDCPYHGLLPQREADQPHYCEYYHGFGEP